MTRGRQGKATTRPRARDLSSKPLVTWHYRVYYSGMLDWSNCTAVERSPERVSGAWLFKGTRVPVKALFENLEEGASVDDFLNWFPGVAREQVLAVLNVAEKSLLNA